MQLKSSKYIVIDTFWDKATESSDFWHFEHNTEMPGISHQASHVYVSLGSRLDGSSYIAISGSDDGVMVKTFDKEEDSIRMYISLSQVTQEELKELGFEWF